VSASPKNEIDVDWWTDEVVKRNVEMTIADGKEYRLEKGATTQALSGTPDDDDDMASVKSRAGHQKPKPRETVEEEMEREMKAHFDAQRQVRALVKNRKR
jgi:hypothetical protein